MNHRIRPATGVSSKWSRRRAATAVETAIVLPILMTLAFGAVDFGRVMGLSAELSNAVWVGAEYGATHRPTTLAYSSWLSGCQDAVLNELSDSNDFSIGQVAVTVNLLTDSSGNQQVEVTATYLFKTVVDWPYLPTRVPLQSTVVMSQYR